jgi:hypothetical protein
MPYLELEDIEAKARKLREVLGLDDCIYLDMMTVVVKAKHLGLIQDYRRVPDHEMPEDEAAYDPEKRLLLIRESTFSAMNRDEPRARFTLAHELGHMALGHTRTRHRNVSGRPIEKIAPTIRRDEAQADVFAGAFLVPAHHVAKPLETSTLDIGARFGLNRTASDIRKSELETMYRREHGIARPIPQNILDLLDHLKKKNPK